MKYLKILIARIKLDILAQSRYRVSMITDIVVMTTLFSFFLISNTGKSFQSQYGYNYKSLLFIGYIVWSMSINAISTLSNFINFEARNGTLQYSMNSVFPMEWILFVEFVSSQIINLVVILALIVVAKFGFSVVLNLSINMVIPIVLCLIGMFGIRLIIAGISMVIKKVGSIILFIQLILLFITDTIPTNKNLLLVTKYIPLTITNEILRNIIINRNYSSQFIILLLSTTLCLVFGIIVFRYFYKQSIKKNIGLLY